MNLRTKTRQAGRKIGDCGIFYFPGMITKTAKMKQLWTDTVSHKEENQSAAQQNRASNFSRGNGRANKKALLRVNAMPPQTVALRSAFNALDHYR